jgi:hypothetical protein
MCQALQYLMCSLLKLFQKHDVQQKEFLQDLSFFIVKNHSSL